MHRKMITRLDKETIRRFLPIFENNLCFIKILDKDSEHCFTKCQRSKLLTTTTVGNTTNNCFRGSIIIKIAEDDSIFDDIHKDTMMQTWKK